MIQCRRCSRFAPAGGKDCPFCGGRDLVPFVPPRDPRHADEHRGYRIRLSHLEIAGSLYRVNGLLARGGCSVILNVDAGGGGESLALKAPFVFDELFSNRQGNSATALRKSEQALWEEIHNFQRVESPHTLRCYFKGPVSASHDGRAVTFPAILMELAPASLLDIIMNHAAGRNPLPLDEKIKIADQLLESTAYLHAQNLVHRDISPANIFAVRRPAGIRYIVSDYGSSRHGDDIDSSRFSSSILANQLYLDPQRLRDPSFAYDPRSDVYSVGIVLAEIFAGDFWHTVCPSARRDGEPMDFHQEVLKSPFKQLLDPRLLTIVAKATASRPNRRHPSIRALSSHWQRYRRRLTAQPPTTSANQWLEPLLLAILSAVLAIALQSAASFFAAAPSQAPQNIVSNGLSIVTRLVLAGDIPKLQNHLNRSEYSDRFGPNGWTPLHWAMYLKRFQTARLLMDHGADWNIPSRASMFGIPAGTTPRQLFLDRYPRLERPAD